MLYLVSAGFNAFEKYAMGCHWSYTCCWSTAPTAESEVTVMMHVGASGSGCISSVALAKASLTLEKAVTTVSFQARVLALLLVLARSEFKG